MERRSLPGIERRYSSAEVCAESGITARQLDYWTRLELFPDVVDPTPGSGHARSFGRRDVELAKAIRRLIEVGVSMAAISKAVRAGRFHDMIERLADAAATVGWTAEESRIA